MLLLHRNGQVEECLNHSFTQCTWKSWPQGSFRTLSPTSNSERQMGHVGVLFCTLGASESPNWYVGRSSSIFDGMPLSCGRDLERNCGTALSPRIAEQATNPNSVNM